MRVGSQKGQENVFPQKGQALVALINNLLDWQRVREELWYRVPVETAPKRWPPSWLAFYQTKVFRDEAFAVRYYGKVREIRRVPRSTLFARRTGK